MGRIGQIGGSKAGEGEPKGNGDFSVWEAWEAWEAWELWKPGGNGDQRQLSCLATLPD